MACFDVDTLFLAYYVSLSGKKSFRSLQPSHVIQPRAENNDERSGGVYSIFVLMV